MSNLLDLQPALSLVLTETQGANVTRYVHAPRGIHAQKDSAGNWEWMVQDGLGSVREVMDNNLNVLWSNSFDPYGTGFGSVGTSQTGYGFTGEPTDGMGLVHLRARDYSPALGAFVSLDPLETRNRYAYANGDPINRRDPSGLQTTCDPNTGVCTDYTAYWAVWQAWAEGLEDLEEFVELSDMWEEAIRQALEGNQSYLQRILNYFRNLNPWPLPLPLPEPDPQRSSPTATPQKSCATNDDPGTYGQFADENDLLCNLERATGVAGPQPITWWQTNLSRRVSITLANQLPAIDRPFDAWGVFAPPGSAVATDEARYLIGGGGAIFVTKPNVAENRTRAAVMATLVEELRHAGQYYSLFSNEGVPECPQLTGQMMERDANIAQSLWAFNSWDHVTNINILPRKFGVGATIYFKNGLPRDTIDKVDEILNAYPARYGDLWTNPRGLERCPQGRPTAGLIDVAYHPILGCIDDPLVHRIIQRVLI